MITKYSIKKNKMLGKYVVWKESKTKHGFSIRGIFQGTRKECEEKLENIKLILKGVEIDKYDK